MDYEKYADEILSYIIANVQNQQTIQNDIWEISRGELALLLYLLEENNGALPKEVSHRFDINTSRVAAILNSLCKKGYVTRVTDPKDKRKIHVYITDNGSKFALDRKRKILNHVKDMLMKLGEKDSAEYLRIVKKCFSLNSGI